MAATEEQLSAVDYGILISLYELRSFTAVLAYADKNEDLFEIVHKFEDVRISSAIKAIIEKNKIEIKELQKKSETAVGKTAVTTIMVDIIRRYEGLAHMQDLVAAADDILDLIETKGLVDTLNEVPTPMLMKAIKQKEITKERLSTENDPQGGSSGG